jgi:hypothetical protein
MLLLGGCHDAAAPERLRHPGSVVRAVTASAVSGRGPTFPTIDPVSWKRYSGLSNAVEKQLFNCY